MSVGMATVALAFIDASVMAVAQKIILGKQLLVGEQKLRVKAGTLVPTCRNLGLFVHLELKKKSRSAREDLKKQNSNFFSCGGSRKNDLGEGAATFSEETFLLRL